MIVVADSGPLHYVIQLGEASLLPRLYSTILIPDAVHRELTRPATPVTVSLVLQRLPKWLRLQPAQRSKLDTIPTTLGSGEREVLSLAEELRVDLVLVDDQAARLEARRRHLRVTGTLGILRSAAERGMIDVPSVLKNLRGTNFYFDEALLEGVFRAMIAQINPLKSICHGTATVALHQLQFPTCPQGRFIGH